jgi:hypothetical protein
VNFNTPNIVLEINDVHGTVADSNSLQQRDKSLLSTDVGGLNNHKLMFAFIVQSGTLEGISEGRCSLALPEKDGVLHLLQVTLMLLRSELLHKRVDLALDEIFQATINQLRYSS